MARFVGCDVGNAFTDLMLLDLSVKEGGERLRSAKTGTRHSDPAAGVRTALAMAGGNVGAVVAVAHASNLPMLDVTGRTYAPCGLILTDGKADDLFPHGAARGLEPAISPDRVQTVTERMTPEGYRLAPDKDDLLGALHGLRAEGVKAIVVHFENAHFDPGNERAAVAVLKKAWEDGYVLAATDISRDPRPAERGRLAILNASLRDRFSDYVMRLKRDFQNQGYSNALLLQHGHGGCSPTEYAVDEPVRALLAGPAAGLAAASYVASASGQTEMIAMDIGSRTCDIGLVESGLPRMSPSIEFGATSSLPLQTAAISSIEIAGSSIVTMEGAGRLRIGSETAEAETGPICFNRGGKDVTLTDASVVAGRIPHDKLVGVIRSGARESARAAIGRIFGSAFGMAPEAAAAWILAESERQIAEHILALLRDRALQPTAFALCAFGGAGPQLAAGVARRLGTRRVIIPPRPAMMGAFGCLASDVRHDLFTPIDRPFKQVDGGDIREIVEKQEKRATLRARSTRLPLVDADSSSYLEMTYADDPNPLSVPLAANWFDRKEILESLMFLRQRRNGSAPPEDMPPHVVGLRTVGTGRRPAVALADLSDPTIRAASLPQARLGERQVFLDGRNQSIPVYHRPELPGRAGFLGPAVIQENDTSLIVGPRDHVLSDETGVITITLAEL